MAKKEFDIRNAVHTPPEASTHGVERVREMEANKHKAIPLPLKQVGHGEYFANLMPGETCAVQAQTSNGKSMFINMWETRLAEYLKQQGREDEAIIHVDTENTVDALAIQEIARLSGLSLNELSRGEVRKWEDIYFAAVKLAGVEVFRIAGLLGEDETPDLHLSNVYRAIQYMVSGEMLDRPITPACIFVDYLQALPIDPEVGKSSDMEGQRRLQVRQDVYRLRRMAQFFNCPVVVGVQAKQFLTGHLGPNLMIPGTYDGEETASIAQRFDRILSLWMPKTTHSVGDTLTHKSKSFQVDEDVMFVKVNKQRGGLPAGRWWPCRIDYRSNSIEPDNRIIL